DITRSRHADHDVRLLNADLEVAARQIVGDGTAGGENRPVLQLLGEAELLDPLADICAAAAARIANRFGREQRRLIGFHRAEVGFGRAGPHRKSETRAHEWRYRAGHDFTVSDEFVDRTGISSDEISRTVVESLLQNGVVCLNDGDLVTARTRERGGEFSYSRRRTLIDQNGDLGCMRRRVAPHGERGNEGKARKIHAFHDISHCLFWVRFMGVSYHVRWRLCNAFDVRATITELSPARHIYFETARKVGMMD